MLPTFFNWVMSILHGRVGNCLEFVRFLELARGLPMGWVGSAGGGNLRWQAPGMVERGGGCGVLAVRSASVQGVSGHDSGTDELGEK